MRCPKCGKAVSVKGYCPPCKKTYNSAWYETHKDEQKARARVNARKHRKRVEDFLAKLKAVPCKDCGKSYPRHVMDFDHVRGTKLFSLGYAANHGHSLKAIEKETKKCEVVCANCHRQRSHERRPRRSTDRSVAS